MIITVATKQVVASVVQRVVVATISNLRGPQGAPGASAPANAIVSDPTDITGAGTIVNEVYMSEAAYNALLEKDPSTLYFLS